MMKRNAMVAILALATAFVCSAEDDNSDEKIKRLIVGSNFYIVSAHKSLDPAAGAGFLAARRPRVACGCL